MKNKCYYFYHNGEDMGKYLIFDDKTGEEEQILCVRATILRLSEEQDFDPHPNMERILPRDKDAYPLTNTQEVMDEGETVARKIIARCEKYISDLEDFYHRSRSL